MEGLSPSHNLAFSVHKIIDSMRACTSSIIKVRSGFSQKFIETTVVRTRRWFGEVLSLIIQTYQKNLKISLICVSFSITWNETQKRAAQESLGK